MFNKPKRILALVLAVMMLTSGLSIRVNAADLPSHVIINQVYGRADKTDAAISHSFIELYNPTESDADLSGYSVQYAKSGASWSKLDLTGVTIAARGSFLIRCYTQDGLASRYTISDYDMDWADCVMDNDAFKVALVSNQELLDVSGPAAAEGVVDLVGAGSADYAYGTAIAEISKQKTARRVKFSDSCNNAADFEILDYRSTGIDDGTLEAVRPRYSGDGAWGLDITPDDVVGDDNKLVFSHSAGLYAEAFSLTMSTGYKDGVIRYTTDGSDPTASSSAYTGAILIEERTNDANVLSAITNITSSGGGGGGSSYTAPSTKVFKGNAIKAQVFSGDGTALTDIYTNSYFVNANYYDLPVISLVTDKANFFDSTIGIYVTGNYENKGADWERPIHFEMFEPDGTTVSLNMGVRINGGTTRSLPQKALRLYAKKGYDADNPTVEYDIFDGSAKTADGDMLTSFKRLILRSSGNDNGSTMMRDAMMQSLVHDTNVMIQAYRQSVVFLNGEFWGIYNIRERIDDESIMRKYNLDDAANVGILEFPNGSNNVPDEYDTSNAAMVADYTAYMTMWNWFNTTTSLASDANYLKAQTFIDIDNFIDYYIANIFVANHDWPGNNNELWRYRTDYPDVSEITEGNWSDGRWRWMLKDTDWGFGLQSATYSSNSLTRLSQTSGGDGFNPSWSTLFFRRLITNEAFKNQLINRFCDLMNTNFKADVVTSKINEMASSISGVMSQHISRWGAISSVTTWNNNVNTMRTFANNRVSYMQTHLRSFFSLSSTTTLNLNTDKSMGYISINGIDITTDTDGVTDPSSWSGTYFINKAQTISASPYEGYKFSKFIVGTTEYDTDTITLTLTGATTVQAVFVEDGDPVTVPVITTPTGALPSGIVGSSYSVAITADNADTFVLSSGSLPDGLSLSNGGVISGTPTAAGTGTFSVTASNSAGTSEPVQFSITVYALPVITTPSGALPSGIVGSSYSVAITADNADTFAISSGNLPDGLSLSNGGVISGTPTAAGTGTFSVTASNSAGTSEPVQFSITVFETMNILPGTIVGTYAANIKVELQTADYDGAAIYFLDGEAKLGIGIIKDGKGTLSIEKAPEKGGTYKIIAELKGVKVAEGSIIVEALNNDIWSMGIYEDADGYLMLSFAESIELKNSKLTVGGKEYSITASTSHTVTGNIKLRDIPSGTLIKISGIKYPRLFPSYSFTFSSIKQ